MIGYLKQSTASQSRIVGPFIDDTDFISPETGLTIANTDVKLSKNGAASVNKNSGGGTHRVNGMYSLTFDATDTDSVGEISISIAMSGALVVVAKFVVLEEQVYDRIFAASALGPLLASEVNAEVDTALSDIHLDHLLAADYDPASKPGTGTALFNELVESDGGVSRFTANALEQAPSGSVSNPVVLQNTTIATLASQVSFTLTAGSADDNAYNDSLIVVTDQSTSTQKAVGRISDYTGSTKTITLESDPGIFTMATGDTVDIIATKRALLEAGAVSSTAIADNALSAAKFAAGALDGKGDWPLATSWTAARALYLDNINIGGSVASQLSVSAIQNAVRNSLVVPADFQIQISDDRFKITLLIFAADSSGLEDPDSSVVTVAVENSSGTSRVANLYDADTAGSATTTMNRVAVGHYELFYEVATGHAEEQLNWLLSYTENAVSMKASAQTMIVAVSAGSGFNGTDRTMLTTVHDDLENGGRLDLIFDSTAADAAAVKAVTDTLTVTTGLVHSVLYDANSAALAKFASVDTGETAAVSGSVASLSRGTGAEDYWDAVQVVDRDATSVKVRIWLTDSSGDPLTGKLFSDGSLELETLSYNGTGWAAKTLVTATLGTWTSNGWIEVGDGIYEYGLPDALITAGERTIVRTQYASGGWRYSHIEATAYPSIDMAQATPGASTVGAQLDAAGTLSAATTAIDVGGVSDAATGQWPSQTVLDTGTASEPLYRHAKWVMTFRGLDLYTGPPEDITFAMKADLADDDADAIIVVEFDLDTSVCDIVRLNGGAGPGTGATGVYQVDTTDATKMEFILTINDDVTTLIPEATYFRGLKYVGESEVLYQDQVTIQTPVLQDITPTP